MEKHPILHLIGLAKRAGKLEIGEEPVGSVARAKQAKLILLANDVSPNTNRRAATFGQIGNVLHLTLPYTKDEIGMSLGRSSVAMLALTDAGFAGAVGDKLVALDPVRYGPAGERLREKADRTLARQREKRRHEKKQQRGKGKPWAVPVETQTALEEKKKKRKSNINSNNDIRPPFRGDSKPYKRAEQVHDSNKEKNKKKNDEVSYSKKPHLGRKPEAGKKLVITRRTGPKDQS